MTTYYTSLLTRWYYYLLLLLIGVFLNSNQTLAQEPGISEGSIDSPLAVDSIQEFLAAILTVVMVLAVPIIVFFIIYAGFLYVTARGNSEQVKQATQAFTYAIIGGLIVLGSMVLVEIIQNLVSAFGAGD